MQADDSAGAVCEQPGALATARAALSARVSAHAPQHTLTSTPLQSRSNGGVQRSVRVGNVEPNPSFGRIDPERTATCPARIGLAAGVSTDDSAGDYDPAAYGDGCAEFYDQLYPRLPAPVLSRLLELAGGRPLLDLGVGTGRVAIPLSRSGCEVWGIDASQAMLQRLRERAVGLPVTGVHADLARFALPQRFGLIVSLMNTLALLPSQDQQACLHRVAAHLRDDGRLLIESIGGSAGDAHTAVTVDTVAGPRNYRVRLYGATPRQIDRMARQAGLLPQACWQDWQGRPWQPSAAQCIALYGLK